MPIKGNDTRELLDDISGTWQNKPEVDLLLLFRWMVWIQRRIKRRAIS
jgi:hypothetical protein